MLLRPCAVNMSNLPSADSAMASKSTGLLKPSLAKAQAAVERSHKYRERHQHQAKHCLSRVLCLPIYQALATGRSATVCQDHKRAANTHMLCRHHNHKPAQPLGVFLPVLLKPCGSNISSLCMTASAQLPNMRLSTWPSVAHAHRALLRFWLLMRSMRQLHSCKTADRNTVSLWPSVAQAHSRFDRPWTS